MEDTRYFYVTKETRTSIDSGFMDGLSFYGGIKQFALCLKNKIALREGVSPDDVVLKDFSLVTRGDCRFEYFSIEYKVTRKYSKEEIEKSIAKYIKEKYEGTLNNVFYHKAGDTSYITLQCDIPRANAAGLMKPFGTAEMNQSVLRDVPGLFVSVYSSINFVD